jgi:enamine deaminase RidA (YjgF/YER057c/UK114 family)
MLAARRVMRAATPVRAGLPALMKVARCTMSTDAKIESLGITLPPPGGPKANYNIMCFESPTSMYLSGHLPIKLDGTLVTGAIGPDGLSVEQGYEAARWCGLNLVSTMKAQLEQVGGSLDDVEKVVKLFGIVSSNTEFQSQHLVMNGASDVIMEVFGEQRGFHARSAIGTNTLPLGASVEVEAIVKLKPGLKI